MSLGSKEPASTPQPGKETSNDAKTSSKDTQLQKKVLNSERTQHCNSHPMISKVQSRAGFFCPSGNSPVIQRPQPLPPGVCIFSRHLLEPEARERRLDGDICGPVVK